MNYGLYLAASGTLTSLHRMDVVANNLANSETPGFKPLVASTRQRETAQVEDRLATLPSNVLLERLGGGVMLMPTRVSLRQGNLETTNRPFDVAIEGTGFLVLRQGAGTGPESLRFSRDGRLAINPRGTLVQASTGLPVLDTTDRPITLAQNEAVSIDSSGNVSQGGRQVASIQVAEVPQTQGLRPAGNGLLTTSPAVMAKRTPATGAQLRQGTIERSAVDPLKAMLAISAAERDAGGSARLIQMFDQLMDRAVNSFGRTLA
jgi:flagellar basal-body rod protein FlgG